MLIHDQSAAPPDRVVVIGAQGFIGRHVVSRVAQAGIPVLALGRAELDLTDRNAAERLGAVLHATDAVVLVSAVMPVRHESQVIANIQMMQVALAGLKAAAPRHLVHISSATVYGDATHGIAETTPAAPSGLQGAAHLMRELMLGGFPAPVARLRPTLLYGPGDPHNEYGPNRFWRQAQAGEPVTLIGRGEERRDHVFIRDVGELVWRVLRHRSSGVLNIATGISVRFADVAAAVMERQGRPVQLRFSDCRLPILDRQFDIAACRAAFPDFRYTSLGEGLDQYSADR